ncbi:hypothetical protein ABT144_02805 [Streptomyces sp. NPDC002039]|uniref:hypothetical protein n=1 Tax=Streptomyces sp. NPDC002039 TaxID=3154660 RepID=UPI0033222B60
MAVLPGSTRAAPRRGVPRPREPVPRVSGREPWESRPERLEACYELASRLRLRDRHHGAHSITGAVLDRPAPDDLLFVQPWVYRWGLLFEHSITSYRVGDVAGSLLARDRLLAMPDLPETYRRQTEVNRGFAVSRAPIRSVMPVSRETNLTVSRETSGSVSRETSHDSGV